MGDFKRKKNYYYYYYYYYYLCTRCVHGGASASMMDSAIGVCVNKCFSFCVTASLTMNYKR